jgi:16S rRNA (guanine527-N7)-methyltransferase
MSTLTENRIAELIHPFYAEPSSTLITQLSVYLDLLLKWNAHTNLTAIRNPEEIVRRHFGESLFAARHLPPGGTLLDLGSGAGFPGIPIQLALPNLRVTLAESQNKKAAFLREAVRSLNLSTQVWAARAESFPAETRFDIVALRAVDNPEAALTVARSLITPGGWLVHLASQTTLNTATNGSFAVPGSLNTVLNLQQL